MRHKAKQSVVNVRGEIYREEEGVGRSWRGTRGTEFINKNKKIKIIFIISYVEPVVIQNTPENTEWP